MVLKMTEPQRVLLMIILFGFIKRGSKGAKIPMAKRMLAQLQGYDVMEVQKPDDR